MYRNFSSLGLNYNCTLDQVISELSNKGNAMLIVPIFKADYPNLSLASSGQRHLLRVEYPVSGYVAITDFDISNGVCYFSAHDGSNYKPWTSTK